jgi:TusA-related sulfurtransferase
MEIKGVSVTMSTSIEPTTTVDARGATCPGPLMDLIGAIRDGESGDVVRLLSDAEQSRTDVPEWVDEAGNTLHEIEEHDDYTAFYVEKA